MTRIVGIDPDLQKSGLALVVDGRLEQLQSLAFFELLDVILLHHVNGAHFALEDVEANKPTFSRGVSPAQMRKISQNVGQVKAVARLIHQYLVMIDAQHTLVTPLRGLPKAAKKDARIFARITGWTGRCNEDQRDAAMLALYGLRGKCIEQEVRI
jgi:hypothetical protein